MLGGFHFDLLKYEPSSSINNFTDTSVSKIPATKSSILRHEWRKFESNKFISDFDHLSMNQYLSKIDSLETHAPLKRA